MAAPAGWYDVGWYRYGPRPGYSGSAVLAGHLDTNTGAPAVFWRLDELVPGQAILYQNQNGEQSNFVVEQIASYPLDQVPLDQIFARGGEARLALITCGGTWSQENQNYSMRIVVYARPG
jgi:sortase (surface protein transpeptidase)